MSHIYRHKCISCGRSRSREFHSRFPAGPHYPVIEGVCRRCRPESEVHVHHHHWLHLPSEDNAEDLEGMHTARASKFLKSTTAARSKKPSNIDPPPGYTELSTERDHLHNTRAELPCDVGPHHYKANHFQAEKPPPVGPKSSISRFRYRLGSLLN
jgi:hypothetical protein